MATELTKRPSLPRADKLRALAIGRLAVRRGTIKSLHIGELTVDRLRVREQLPAARNPSRGQRALPRLTPYAPPVAEGEQQPAEIPGARS
jgi:hypothetical protein